MCCICHEHFPIAGMELCPMCYVCIYPLAKAPPRVTDLHRYHPPPCLNNGAAVSAVLPAIIQPSPFAVLEPS